MLCWHAYQQHSLTLRPPCGVLCHAVLCRAAEVVEAMCGIAPMLMGETVENVAAGIDCYTMRQPLGVCAGICPFNFPAMVPLW